MNLSRENKLLIGFAAFCLILVGIYLYKLNIRNHASKIILESKNNPFKVTKPEPKNSNLTLEEINKHLKNSQLKNNNELEIDDIN